MVSETKRARWLEIAPSLVWVVSLAVAIVALNEAPKSLRWTLAGLAGGWLLAAFLLAVPYCLRFGGTWLDGCRVGLGLGVLFALPLLPLIWHPTRDPWLMLGVTVVGLILMWRQASTSLTRQGYYDYTTRDLPELEGEPIRIARETLERCGLRPLSIRVAPLGSINAVVHGLRTCVVVLDRSAASRLTPDELRALLAHEAGHVRCGGVYPYLVVLPALLCLYNALGTASVVDLVAAFFCATYAVSQAIELVCDAFAARMAGQQATCSMLRKVTSDLPLRLARLSQSWWPAPFATHPPTRLRCAFLGEGGRGATLAYPVIGTLLFTVVVVYPFLPWRLGWRLLPTSLAYLAGLVTTSFVLGWARHRDSGYRDLAGPRGWRLALLVAVGAAWALFLLSVSLSVKLDPSPTWIGALLGGLLGALLLTVVAVLAGAFRFGTILHFRGARQAIAETSAPLFEGRPVECVELADKHMRLQSLPVQAHLRLLRANACFLLGRLDEAYEDLQMPLAHDHLRSWAAVQLWLVEWHRGRFAESQALELEVFRRSPEEASIWYQKGYMAYEAGRLTEAEAALQKACELKPQDPGTLAARAMVAFESAPNTPEADAWLDEARRLEPEHPSVLLAGSRQAALRGDAEAARSLHVRSKQALEKRGYFLYLAEYEKLAGRWGIG